MAGGGENIREMLAGFNAMQAQLGLLPPQTAQMPMGVQLNQPPPPPPVMHPGQFGAMAMQQHQSAVTNSMQFAQMTRYTPPAAAPVFNPYTWQQTTSQVQANQFNPQVANFMSGGQAQGMPSPVFSTAPQFGMYRPGAGPTPGQPFVPSAPHILNPLAMPGAMFQPQYMRDYQINRAQQGGLGAGALGLAQGAFEMGGGALGGALGGAFLGPLGGMAGSWLGSRAGAFVGNVATAGVGRDLARGMQIQNMTSPFMVTGANLDPFTGAGMSRQAGLDTAVGLRRMTREHDFARQTGFNTQDIMQLTQAASEQGLLATAQNPEDIIRRMRDVSKAIRVITQITGDPDVKAAMKDLGNMRNLGFEGLPNQMGAISNRAMFARMAGVSQTALAQQFGMPGAMMAQGVGLAGATGYAAGMAGAGMANVGISGGAFTDLQLARAGGRQGVAQTNALAQIGAANQPLWIAASLVSKGGKLDFDIDAYRRAQRMGPGQVAEEASRRMQQIGPSGISDLQTRMQEFKDRAAQEMGPNEGMMNAIRQIQGYAETSGLTFGGAATQMLGDPNQARALELQVQSQGFWKGMQQQTEFQRRTLRDRARAARAVNRTGGFFTQVGQGISATIGGVGEAIAAPIRGAVSYLDERAEERMAFERGERVQRFGEGEIIRTERDRELARAALARTGSTAGDVGLTGGSQRFSLLNELTSGAGLSSLSNRNKIRRLASRARGELFGTYDAAINVFTSGNIEEDVNQLESVRQAAGLISASQTFTGATAAAGMGRVSKTLGGQAAAYNAVHTGAQILGSMLPTAGLFKSAGTANMETIKKASIQALTNTGMSTEKATEYMESPAGRDFATAMIRRLSMTANGKHKEVLENTVGVTQMRGSLDKITSVEGARKELENARNRMFMTEESLTALTGVLRNQDPEAVAYAALQQREQEAKEAVKNYGPASQRALTQATLQREAFVKGYKGDIAKLTEAAEGVLQGVSAEGRTGLARLAGADTLGNVKQLTELGGSVMGKTAVQATYDVLGGALGGEWEKLSDVSPAGIAAVVNKLANLGDKDLAKLPTNLRRVAKQAAAAQGDKAALGKATEAFADVALASGPRATTNVTGAREQGEEALDDAIAQYEELSKKLAKPESAEEASQQVFAKGSEMLALAAKDLLRVTEHMAIKEGLPMNQAEEGGSQ